MDESNFSSINEIDSEFEEHVDLMGTPQDLIEKRSSICQIIDHRGTTPFLNFKRTS